MVEQPHHTQLPGWAPPEPLESEGLPPEPVEHTGMPEPLITAGA
jgi:hypothetical protein